MARSAGVGYFRYGAATEERRQAAYWRRTHPEEHKRQQAEERAKRERTAAIERAGMVQCVRCDEGVDFFVAYEKRVCPHCGGDPLDDFAD